MYNTVNLSICANLREVFMKKTILLSCIAATLCFALGLSAMALIKGGSAKDSQAREDVIPELLNMTDGITVATKSFYPDHDALAKKLSDIRYGVENGLLDDEALLGRLENAKRELEQLGYYYDYVGNTSLTDAEGVIYGALAAESGPVGGGAGYSQIYGVGFYDYDYLVNDDNEFFAALKRIKPGEMIYLGRNAVVDISDLQITNFPEGQIPEGIIIASGRDGEGGGTLKMSLDQLKMFALASNVRLTGLVIEGPDGYSHGGDENYFHSSAMEIKGSGIEIDNCEISGFSGAGIIITEGDAYIHHCYIHHIRGGKDSSGILVKGGSAKVEYNLFSNCSNAVSVEKGASLEATNNVEVGNGSEAMFSIMGDDCSVILKNNTVLGKTLPISLGGVPTEYAVENNLFFLNDTQYEEALFYGAEGMLPILDMNK